jgi:hypothetical protein
MRKPGEVERLYDRFAEIWNIPHDPARGSRVAFHEFMENFSRNVGRDRSAVRRNSVTNEAHAAIERAQRRGRSR